MKTTLAYDEAFQRERANAYPEVDVFEMTAGYAIDRARLEAAARVLACPVKKNPPNWQHGRVIYAAVRELLEDRVQDGVLLDIGTAKGFSAVVMAWAAADAGLRYPVWSVDVVEPSAQVPRNSAREADGGLFTVHEFVAEFLDPQQHHVRFFGGGSLALLRTLVKAQTRVRFAFVDGKHNGAVVAEEARVLAGLQRYGDVLLFDDVQIPCVAAVTLSLPDYAVTYLRVNALRSYALAVRR